MSHKILGAAILAVVASAATAEEIKSVKKSAGQQVSDSLYGNVEARVQTYQFVDAAGNTQGTRSMALRPKLGTKILNDKLDLNLTMPLTNRQGSGATTRAQPEAEGTLSLYDHPNLAVELYTFNFLQTNEKAYDGYADLDITIKKDFELAFGKLETSMLIEPEANLSTKSKTATVSRLEREDGRALAESDPQPASTAEQKETNKALTVYPLVFVHPSALPGFKVGLGALFMNNYTPRYRQVVEDNGDSALKSDGYDIARSTQVRYTVKYQINETVSVYNQLRQNLNGYANASLKAGDRLDNRTGITMSLF